MKTMRCASLLVCFGHRVLKSQFFCQLSDTSAEHESYFADPHAESATPPAPRPVDEKGYVVRQSVTDESTQLSYVIPVGSAAGASGMMVKVRHFHSEGWFSLWKGKCYWVQTGSRA